MSPPELTFDLLDDLVLAAERGRRSPVTVSGGSSVGPTVEFLLYGHGHGEFIQHAPSPMLQAARKCLLSGKPAFVRGGRAGFVPARRCFLDGEDVYLVQFKYALHKAMLAIGMPSAFVAGFVGALGEMESNIHEHSNAADTGIIAYSVTEDRTEWIVADRGIGVFSGLNAVYPRLADAGDALRFALTDGRSRFRNKDRGHGFRELFKALAARRAALRFRTDDQLLTIKGVSPALSRARLTQRAPIQGFSVSAVCAADRLSHSA